MMNITTITHLRLSSNTLSTLHHRGAAGSWESHWVTNCRVQDLVFTPHLKITHITNTAQYIKPEQIEPDQTCISHLPGLQHTTKHYTRPSQDRLCQTNHTKCISHQIKQNAFPTRSSKIHFPPDQAKCISHQIKQNTFPTRSSKMHFPPDQAKCISHQIKQNAFPTCQDSSTCSVMRPQQCSWLWVMSQALKIQFLSHFHVIVFVQAKLFLPLYRHFRLVGHNCVIIRKMLQK